MQDISILNRDWLLIGRQVRTDFDRLIYLLAIVANDTVIIINLKRDKTPVDVVAQAIDYASWLVTLADYQLIDIYQASPSAITALTPLLKKPSRPRTASRWTG